MRPVAPPLYARSAATLVPCLCACSHCNRGDADCTMCKGTWMITVEQRREYLLAMGRE